MLPPRNWGGTWPGSNSPNIQPWQPVRILALPKIPSRYKSNCEHTVLIAYVPVQLPLRYPAVGLCTPNLQRIQMWICGPRVIGKCKAGARTATCCAHVATAIYACGLL